MSGAIIPPQVSRVLRRVSSREIHKATLPVSGRRSAR